VALPTVGRAGVLEVAGAGDDGVTVGALVVGRPLDGVDEVGALLELVGTADDEVGVAVLRVLLAVGWLAGRGCTTAGFVVPAAVGCTLR
jgi:hypothetical protein